MYSEKAILVAKTVIANGNLTIHEEKILQTHLGVLHLVRTSTGMLRLIWVYLNYGYGRSLAMAMGVLRLQLRGYAWVYYVNAFTAYTVCPS